MIDVGQLARGVVVAGFDGHVLDPSLPVFGGYILFARNGTSLTHVRALSDALRARPDNLFPLITIDQEGGRVARLRQGVEPMPSMMAMGAAGDLELAGRAGEQIAFDLRRAGCTLDFAPVLDLALSPGNTVIGTRSLGSDPSAVSALGGAFADGLARGGIMPCPKHFPGHGSTEIDSHEALPIVDAGAEVLRARDLRPFAALAQRVPAMMGTHAMFHAFDRTQPATVSSRIVTDLLRRELGFAGAFVTDCLQMSALADFGPPEQTAVAAIAAGADLLIVSQSTAVALDVSNGIERAVRDGRLSLARLQEACARVLRLRSAASAPIAVDQFPPHPGVGREIARRAVTVVRGFPRVDPVTATAVSFEGMVRGGIDPDAGKDAGSLRREAPALHELVLGLEPDDAEVTAALCALRESGRRPLILSRRSHRYPGQATAIVRIVAEFGDAVLVSMLEPFDLALFPSARHVLAAYGDDAASIGGLADVVFGGSLAQGRLPVDLSVAL